ncbi:MazG nucleotide pyrophosphohydrolase domain-containing protein [Floridanema aerugineum]|uniref:MazG nucleotide pyrophosphohydrolase domain-containing protein n=1 Tax=Floridaenema aerugineum BLCC-F46 TaxID=3153654 RepID=A0ABV4X321_9CYAN
MNFQQYQEELTNLQKFYPVQDTGREFFVRCLELSEETGEVVSILKRLFRGDYTENQMPEVYQQLSKELGDVLAAVTLLANHFDLNLADIAAQNLEKINNRVTQGTLVGTGSDR